MSQADIPSVIPLLRHLPEVVRETDVLHWAQARRLSSGWEYQDDHYLASMALESHLSNVGVSNMDRLLSDPHDQLDHLITVEDVERNFFWAGEAQAQAVVFGRLMLGDMTALELIQPWPREALSPNITAEQEILVKQASRLTAKMPLFTPEDIVNIDPLSRIDWNKIVSFGALNRRVVANELTAAVCLQSLIELGHKHPSLQSKIAPLRQTWQAANTRMRRQSDPWLYKRARRQLVETVVSPASSNLIWEFRDSFDIETDLNYAVAALWLVMASRLTPSGQKSLNSRPLKPADNAQLQRYLIKSAQTSGLGLEEKFTPSAHYLRQNPSTWPLVIKADLAVVLPAVVGKDWQQYGQAMIDHDDRLNQRYGEVSDLYRAQLNDLADTMENVAQNWRDARITDSLPLNQTEVSKTLQLETDQLLPLLELVLLVKRRILAQGFNNARQELSRDLEIEYDASLTGQRIIEWLNRVESAEAGITRPLAERVNLALQKWDKLNPILVQLGTPNNVRQRQSSNLTINEIKECLAAVSAIGRTGSNAYRT